MMEIDHQLIDRILEDYPIDTWVSAESLDSGFHSDNVRITTDFGDLVVRRLVDDPLSIRRMMFIYDFLSEKGFPTATPVKTLDDSYFTTLIDQHFVIQKYIDGVLPVTDTKEEALRITETVAETIGSFHKLLQEMDYDVYKQYSPNYKNLDIISWLTAVEITDDGIYFPQINSTLEDDYILEQYTQWLDELEDINLDQLQQGICHNDINLGVFRFNSDGDVSGVLDFGSAEHSYHLYDIAGYMMYSNMYSEQIGEMFLKPFFDTYLANTNMSRQEVRHLRFFVKARFILQVFYFFSRLHAGDLQGVESTAGNQQGFSDGIAFLEHLGRIPEDFYVDTIGL